MSASILRAVMLYYEEADGTQQGINVTLSLTYQRPRNGRCKANLTAEDLDTGEVLNWETDSDAILAVIPEDVLPSFVYSLPRRSPAPVQDALPL